ncbi:MAG: DUF480 domain-containing protein [Stagnimonas sp.]|nr:DUF480 domain-containing protein [Stagnimonas sp.]
MSALLLTVSEARVIASLTEKSLTTPDYYPMTVNGLMAACNQKSSRNPAMALTEGEVGNALLTLEEKGFVGRDDSSARATKWRSRFMHQLLLKPATQAVLVTLMLRSAQTTAELRANAAPMNGPADADGVQAALDDLADRAQPLVLTLPRSTGQSAVRHAHLLCGEPVIPAFEESTAAPRITSNAEARFAALEARVAALEQKLAELGG